MSVTRKLHSLAIFCKHLRSLQLLNQLINFMPLVSPNIQYRAHNTLFDSIITQHNPSYSLSGRTFAVCIFSIYNYVSQIVSFLQSVGLIPCAYFIPQAHYLPRPPHGPSCFHLNYKTICQACLKVFCYFSSRVNFFYLFRFYRCQT